MTKIGPSDKSNLSFKERFHWINIELRGMYLDIACDIEFLLTDITCACLINNNEEKVVVRDIFFENVMMGKKINLAINALKKYNEEHYKKYKECFNSFSELNTLRNKFAHSQISGDPFEKDESLIIFEYVKNGKSVKEEENRHSLYGKLLEYRDAVNKLLDFVPILYHERHIARGGKSY